MWEWERPTPCPPPDISFSDRNMSANVWSRLLGSFIDEMGISSNNVKFPSPKCYTALCDMGIYSDTFN